MKPRSGSQVVAIDGPAGAGKSTVAKLLASRLGFSYLDTGAMYRSLTLKAMRGGVDLTDGAALADLARRTEIDIIGNPASGVKVILDGEDVSEAIRTPEVTNQTFHIAGESLVREVMVGLQRRIGSRADVVIEGRDIGTVVFPEAQHKFYLDATVEERALRRHKEFLAKGKASVLEQVLQDVQARDHKDFTRRVGPLRKAADAIVIDSSAMTIDEVIACMASHILGKQKS